MVVQTMYRTAQLKLIRQQNLNTGQIAQFTAIATSDTAGVASEAAVVAAAAAAAATAATAAAAAAADVGRVSDISVAFNISVVAANVVGTLWFRVYSEVNKQLKVDIIWQYVIK